MSFIGSTSRDIAFNFIGNDRVTGALRSIDSSTKRTTRSAGLLAKTLRVAALAAATALAAAAAVAARFLWNATKAAYADDIAMKKLAFTQMKAQDATKAQTKATSDLIDKLELATGIADDEMRPAMAALAGTGMDVEKSQRLLAVALDVSVARGKSVQTVAEALAKAYNGQTTSLQRLGIKVTDAKGDALSFAEVLKQLKGRFEGAAKAAGKSDPLKRLGAAYHQLQEEVGAQLLPILRRFSNWMIKVAVPWIKTQFVPWVKKAAEWLGKHLSDAAKKIGEWWDGGGKKKFDELWQSIKDMWGSLKKLVGSFADLLTNGDDVSNKSGDWAESLDTITESLDGMFSVADKVVGALDGVVSTLDTINEKSGVFSYLNPIGIAGHVRDYVTGNADGGWLDKRARGGWTMVGEHGPELINNRGFVKTHSQSMGAGGGNTYITVQGAIDPVGTARQIERILAKGGRVMGRGQLASA